MNTVTIGISSGIAAYKMIDLAKLLKSEGINSFIIMTNSATKMVNPKEFEKVTGNKPYTDLFPDNFDYKEVIKKREVDHIKIADETDMLCIAPATANVIAKLAHGISDDFLTTTALATTAPILLCPSMNPHMWTNPATAENIEILKKRGYIIMVPDEGDLACGYKGIGRLPTVKKIRDEIVRLLNRSTSLSGKKVLVTAGGTRETIDDVRVITNRSSGKMGVALAEACYLRGATVTLLRATAAVAPRYQMEQETFETADQLKALMKKHIPRSDICFHVAAVSDFTVDQKYRGKISIKESITIKLIPQEKIANSIKKWNPKIKLIAFKAESNISEKELIAKARMLLKESGADMIVANDVGKKGQGFGSEMNEVILVIPSKKIDKIRLTLKATVAENIVARL